MSLAFPEGFVWGAATASYQIEGSPLADGASPSIWHRFSHTPGNIHDGDTGDLACDHYRRWPKDIQLMGELGLGAYRFSIAWPRIVPDGVGAVNQAGLDHYARFVDALLDAGITPFVTLYHWDLPGVLQDRGGWANRDCASWFADYADAVFSHLGDRVRHWITLNEPWATSFLGYILGRHAPGIRDLWAGLRAVHHLLLGHGRAVAACRARDAGAVGITNVTAAITPASDREEDVAAADRLHAVQNRLFFDPIFEGSYPKVLLEAWQQAWPELPAADLAEIAAPIDFAGVNYYFGSMAADAPGEGLLGARRIEHDRPMTEMEWPVYPEGLHHVLTWMRDAYDNPPLYVTENGAAFQDSVSDDGEVADDDRLSFYRDHLGQAHRAIDDGVDLRGFFAWSLLDNFEWTHGYSKRFGLVRVDYQSQQRTVKRSGHWYAQVARANALPGS